MLALWLNILMGRTSDRIGRRLSIFLMMTLCGAGYAVFYSGLHGPFIPPLWIVSFFAFFSADALMAALAIEIVPTAYRATVGGLRYMVEIFMGGVSLPAGRVLVRPLPRARPGDLGGAGRDRGLAGAGVPPARARR